MAAERMQSKRVNTVVKEILAQLKKVIVGKDEVLLWVIAAILAKGHICWKMCRVWGKPPWRSPFPKP